MSKQGVKIAAKVLSDIQENAYKLINMGTINGDTQDILLGHMFNLDEYVRNMKDRFTKLVTIKSD
jgi:hypothetical protein